MPGLHEQEKDDLCKKFETKVQEFRSLLAEHIDKFPEHEYFRPLSKAFNEELGRRADRMTYYVRRPGSLVSCLTRDKVKEDLILVSPITAAREAYKHYVDELKILADVTRNASHSPIFRRIAEVSSKCQKKFQVLRDQAQFRPLELQDSRIARGLTRFYNGCLNDVRRQFNAFSEIYLKSLHAGTAENSELYDTIFVAYDEVFARAPGDLRKKFHEKEDSDLFKPENCVVTCESKLCGSSMTIIFEGRERSRRVFSGELLHTQVDTTVLIGDDLKLLAGYSHEYMNIRGNTSTYKAHVLKCLTVEEEAVGWISYDLGGPLRNLMRTYGDSNVGCLCDVSNDYQYRATPPEDESIRIRCRIFVREPATFKNTLADSLRSLVQNQVRLIPGIKCREHMTPDLLRSLRQEQALIQMARGLYINNTITALNEPHDLIAEKENLEFSHIPANMTAKFREHQRTGLSWMLAMEQGTQLPNFGQRDSNNDTDNTSHDVLPLFWKRVKSNIKGDYYFHRYTHFEATEKLGESLSYGGILGDDMGLGKTLLCLSLIASDRYPLIEMKEEVGPAAESGPKVEASDRYPVKQGGASGVAVKQECTVEPSLTAPKQEASVEYSTDGVKNEWTDDGDCQIVDLTMGPESDVDTNNNRWRPRPHKRKLVCLSSSDSDDSDDDFLNRSFTRMRVKHEHKKPATSIKSEAGCHDGPVKREPKPVSLARLKNDYGPSLIVAPLGVMSNWEHQLELHFKKSSLSVLKYYGLNRHSTSVARLKKSDIVITSYSTLRTDLKKAEKEELKDFKLLGIDWHRVILDEAHYIKGPNTIQSRACCVLKARKRWFVTGTPVQNNVADLFGAMRFLRVVPLNEKSRFNNIIAESFERGGLAREGALKTVRNILALMMLRRTKQDSLETVPKRRIIQKRIVFSKSELDNYNLIRKAEKLSLKKLGITPGSETEKIMKGFLSIMGALMKMRKCCDSDNLIENHLAGMRHIEQKGVELNDFKRTVMNLQLDPTEVGRLQDELHVIFTNDVEAQCKVCCSTLTETTVAISSCHHVACADCLRKIAETKGNCPTCNVTLNQGHILKLRKEVLQDKNWLFDSESEDDTDNPKKPAAPADADKSTWSSKMTAIMEIIQKHFDDPKNGKIVVVSQFLDFQAEIAQKLKHVSSEKGYRVMTFNGSISEKRRAATLNKFENEDRKSKDILLLALVSGSVGLNLTAANTMIIAEPNWNPGREAQCQDRVYRIGQTRPVTVYKLYVRGTIERKMLNMQRAKRHVMEAVCVNMGGKNQSNEQAKLQRVKDMQAILDHVFNGSGLDAVSDGEDEIEIDELGNSVK